MTLFSAVMALLLCSGAREGRDTGTQLKRKEMTASCKQRELVWWREVTCKWTHAARDLTLRSADCWTLY